MAKSTTAAKGGQKSASAKSTGSSSSSLQSKKSTNGSSSNGSSKKSSEESGLKALITKIAEPFKTKKTLDDLFEEGLNDILSAEEQLIKALPELEEASETSELKKAFAKHLKQTQRHKERLEKIMDKLDIDKNGETCKAMEGLVKESNKIISDFEEGPVRDSALIIASQKVEHYEIATYGSLVELADVLGYTKAGHMLETTLEEEKETDELLTEIAMQVNDEACELSADIDDEDEDN
jgi:ferritin-like metal-binding protein YciE